MCIFMSDNNFRDCRIIDKCLYVQVFKVINVVIYIEMIISIGFEVNDKILQKYKRSK